MDEVVTSQHIVQSTMDPPSILYSYHHTNSSCKSSETQTFICLPSYVYFPMSYTDDLLTLCAWDCIPFILSTTFDVVVCRSLTYLTIIQATRYTVAHSSHTRISIAISLKARKGGCESCYKNSLQVHSCTSTGVRSASRRALLHAELGVGQCAHQ